MLKRLGIAIITLLSTFSVVYAMNQNLLGTTLSPSNIVPLQQGSKIHVGSYEENDVIWDVMINDGSEYIIATSKSIGLVQFCNANTAGLEFYFGPNYNVCNYRSSTKPPYVDNPVTDSGAYTKIADFNKKAFHPNEDELLVEKYPEYGVPTFVPTAGMINAGTQNNGVKGTFGFTQTSDYTMNSIQYYLSDRVREPNAPQLTYMGFAVATGSVGGEVHTSVDNTIRFDKTIGRAWATLSYPSWNSAPLRPFAVLPYDEIVFGADAQWKDNDFHNVSLTTKQGDEKIEGAMKLRQLDDTLQVSLDSISNTKLLRETFQVRYSNATVGTDYYISAIIRDKDGIMKGYQKLELAKPGTNEVVVDISTITNTGEYTIQLVNEVVSDDARLTTSSHLSNGVTFTVFDPHSIEYSSTPQNQDRYEHTKNVSPRDKVGEITRTDGIVPISYKIVSDGDDSYKNFEIAGLRGTGDSFETSLVVQVKEQGAPDVVSTSNSLKAGTYKFCIESTDENGNPKTQVNEQSKVCTSFSVDKTKATLSFASTAQQDMKIGDTTFSDSIITNNTDIRSASDITYTLSGGVTGVLSVTPHSTDTTKYNLDVVNTHTGTGLPAMFTLQATLKETENYVGESTSTSRSIYVYKELSDITWNANKTNYLTSDVVTGSTIGDLLAHDGVGPYTYTLSNSSDEGYVADDAKDNGNFTIANGTNISQGTKANVNTTTSLAIGSYHLQFKVIDAKGKALYTTTTITVSAKVQSIVDFKDKAGGTIITGKGISIKYNDKNTALFAEGGSTTMPIEYYVADQEDQPGKIDPSAYLSVNKSNGLLEPMKVGTIKVYAKRPKDATYGDMNSGFMEVSIEPAEQIISFNDSSNPGKVAIGKTLLQDASGKVKKDKTAGIGGITYVSSDPSVASVDEVGNVTGIKADSVSITAKLNDPSSSTYNANYETQSCQKSVNVYESLKLTWTKETPHLQAESSRGGSKAGRISVASNDGSVNYKIGSNTGIAANVDGALFQVIGNNLSADVQLKDKITAENVHAHGNQYYVQVEATDRNGTSTIDIVITVDDAKNDAFFTEAGNKVTALSKVYGEDKNSFQLYSNTSNGGNVTYQIDPSDTSGVLSTNGAGVVTINKVGTTRVQAVVSAGSGYDGATISMPITITAGNQSIAFQDSTTLNRAFKENTTFQELAQLQETSKNEISSRVIVYTSNNISVCSVDVSGNVTMHSTGICDITASNADANWTAATSNKRINLYDGMGVSFIPTSNLQAENVSTNANAKAGVLQVSGGLDPVTFTISSDQHEKNKDASFFQVNASGIVTFKKAIQASDLIGKYNNHKGVYELYVQLVATDREATKVISDVILELKGAPLRAEIDTNGTGKISEEYGLGKTFALNTSSNKGNGIPTYQLKNDPNMPQDVLESVDPSGLITILHANDESFVGNPLKVEAIIPASNGYDGETMEVEIEITKTSQPDFAFKTPNMKLGHGASTKPLFIGELSSGSIRMSSGNSGLASISGDEIVAKSSDGTVEITAIKNGDRDYKSANAKANVTISSEPAYNFVISVPAATYGDEDLQAIIEINEANGANKVQTWQSDHPSIADIDADGKITIYKAGSVNITCTQTSTGEPSVSATVVLVVEPKPISITIHDKRKYVGEAMPSFEITIPSDVLVGDDTITLPTFRCVDEDKKLVNAFTPVGTYPITGSYTTNSNPNYNISVIDGNLEVKQDSSLPTWFQLVGEDSEVSLDPTMWHNEDINIVLHPSLAEAGTYDEISLDKTLWSSTQLQVSEEGEHQKDVYFRIQDSNPTHPLALASPQATTIKIDKTDPVIKSMSGTLVNKDEISQLLNNLSFGNFFKPGTKVSIQGEDPVPNVDTKVSGLANISYEVYEIDSTGHIGSIPSIAKTSLTPDEEGIVEFTFDSIGKFRICAIATDTAGNIGPEKCSDINVKKIDMDVDDDNDSEFVDPDGDGCPDINIPIGKDEEGNWIKLNVDRNKDNIPDLNIDSDGDGIGEINVDTDQDGKPDLNLINLTVWRPSTCVEGQAEEYCTMPDIKAEINIDLKKDLVPDINIDNNGDMKADLNISKDGKKAYLNIVKLHEWKPLHDFNNQGFLYDSIGTDEDDPRPELNIDTDDDGRPDVNVDSNDDGKEDLNIDMNGDLIPDIDIDGDGDGKPDINVDTNEDGEADKNVIKITEWKPNKDVDGDILYDTMEFKNKSELEDNGIKVEKPDGTFLPNFAIKVKDVTNSVNQTEKDKIQEQAKDQEIKAVYEVHLLKDDVQVNPDGTLKVKIPVSKGIKNPKLVIQQKDGSYKTIEVKEEDGYYVYESDFLGNVSVIGDKVEDEEEPPVIPEDPKIPDENPPIHKPPVQGSYIGGIGGASTGDETNIEILAFGGIFTIGILFLLAYKRRKQE